MNQIIRSVALVAALSCSVPVTAQNYDDKLAAPNTAPDRLDFARALEWIRTRELVEQGDVVAQINLGLMYYNGDGVPQDFAEAARLFGLAAEQGSTLARYNLGVVFSVGHGVPQDYAEAMRWFWLAAERGYGAAQRKLGDMYQFGWGVPQDYALAHMWYNIASANGLTEASDLRDQLAGQMTPAQIAEAQARARVCMTSDYQDCD